MAKPSHVAVNTPAVAGKKKRPGVAGKKEEEVIRGAARAPGSEGRTKIKGKGEPLKPISKTMVRLLEKGKMVTPGAKPNSRGSTGFARRSDEAVETHYASGLILGLEGGGTKTTWVLIDAAAKRVVRQGQTSAGNVQLMSDSDLKKNLLNVRRVVGPKITAIGGAFAGCQLPSEQKRVEAILRSVWPKALDVRAGEDSRSGLCAAFGTGPGILVIAGTGANVVGQDRNGRLEKVIGWGHLFGDRASAYDLVRRGLELVYRQYDIGRKVSPLAQEFLRATKHKSLEEMVPFLLANPAKAFLASWAHCVFAAATKGDVKARMLVQESAVFLAENAALVAKRLKMSAPRIALIGGLFENQAYYFDTFQRALKKRLPKAEAFLLSIPGAIGAARLVGAPLPGLEPAANDLPAPLPSAAEHRVNEPAEQEEAPKPIPSSSDTIQPAFSERVAPSDPNRLSAYALAMTEQRNPRSRGLDRRDILEIVDLFIHEEHYVETALRAQRKQIARACEMVAQQLAAGGRLFYLGAGTSGRLAVVDASEMEPTFNAPRQEIQAIIAGGTPALFKSQEGAEDSIEAAGIELERLGVNSHDVVCGISASGQTPFVLGGLEFAGQIGASTILVSCNPARTIRVPVTLEIDLPTGPEIVTGSTRLKAGTVTKLVLNMLSTIANIRLGRVRDNLMVNVQASNDKLRARAIRLVQELAQCDSPTATEALVQTKWSVLQAVSLLESSAGEAAKDNSVARGLLEPPSDSPKGLQAVPELAPA